MVAILVRASIFTSARGDLPRGARSMSPLTAYSSIFIPTIFLGEVDGVYLCTEAPGWEEGDEIFFLQYSLGVIIKEY